MELGSDTSEEDLVEVLTYPTRMHDGRRAGKMASVHKYGSEITADIQSQMSYFNLT